MAHLTRSKKKKKPINARPKSLEKQSDKQTTKRIFNKKSPAHVYFVQFLYREAFYSVQISFARLIRSDQKKQNPTQCSVVRKHDFQSKLLLQKEAVV